MDVREMGMPVRQRHVLMEMGMGLDAIPIRAVPMLVVQPMRDMRCVAFLVLGGGF